MRKTILLSLIITIIINLSVFCNQNSHNSIANNIESIDLDPEPKSDSFNKMMELDILSSNKKMSKGDGTYISESDSLVLVSLYNSTNGENWRNNTNWLIEPVNSWYGIVVEKSRIEEINVSYNKLSGTIPKEITTLKSLKKLNFQYNNLTGVIPLSIGDLDSLKYLSLSFNELSGELPQSITNLDSLEYLYLSWNELDGTIPSELQKLKKLKRLYLSFNNFTGTIPNEIESISNLEHLSLSGNYLTGTIPEFLGNMTKLTVLKLFNNEFSGVIPVEIGNLPELYWLDISGNQITGSIPVEIANHTKISILNLSKNNLTGDIPVEISSLINLNELYLDNNSFTSCIDLSTNSKLRQLNISSNNLSFGDLEKLNIDLINTPNPFDYNDQIELSEPNQTTTESNFIFNFTTDGTGNTYQWFKDGNILNGETSTELRIMDNEEGIFHCEVYNSIYPKLILSTKPIYLNVDTTQGIITEEYNTLVDFYNSLNGEQWINNNNWLSEKDPNTWFGIITSGGHVVSIELTDNNLTGNITSEIGKLSMLSLLNLSFNKITGNIPENICNINSISKLYLESNMLNGTIPEDIGKLSLLKTLSIDNNKLSGNLPVQIGNLNSLENLYLGANQLEGSIPEEIGLLSLLENLVLGDNNFSGTIPSTIGNLTNLERLSLWKNNLSGGIPESIGNLFNLGQLSLGKNNLTGKIPSKLSQLVNLFSFNIEENNLNEICDLSYMELFSFDIEKNLFTFSDLESTNINFEDATFSNSSSYSPQNILPLVTRNIYLNNNENLTLNCKQLSNEELLHQDNEFAILKDQDTVYKWSSNPEYIITSFSTENNGKYTFQVRNSNYPDLILTSDTILIRINNSPTNITLNNDNIDENNPVGSFVGQFSSDDNDEYEKLFFSLVNGDGNNDADNSLFNIEADSLFTATELDYETKSEYNIYVQVTDAEGLTFEKAFTIRVNDVTETGIKSFGMECSIYPNPSTGLISIKTEKSNYQISVYDIAGSLVYSNLSKIKNKNIDLTKLHKGQYIIEIKFPNKKFSKKIILQ